MTQKLNYSKDHFMSFIRVIMDIKYIKQGKPENFLEDYNNDVMRHNS